MAFSAGEKELGSEMRGRVLSVLREMEFRPDAFCIIHDRRCPLDPRAEDPSPAEYIHIEYAGNTCTHGLFRDRTAAGAVLAHCLCLCGLVIAATLA